MSSISEMQYKVNEQRRLNNELHSELNAIMNGIQQAYNSWNNLCNNISTSLNNGVQRVNASQEAINAAYEMQGEIDKMYELFKNIEQANKKIRECNNKKIYDFANYSAVRKIVSAMLDNIEVNFVSDATIAKSVEVKHLQIPDYWLTCALLSIMAWKKNDKALAGRALERACKLDKKETAVFFMAFNLRINREVAALKWFEYYQTCDLSGEDDRTFLLLFSIVNKAITQNCSEEVIAKVSDFIKQVIRDDLNKSGYDEQFVINRISRYLQRFIPNDSIAYPLLMKHCTEANYLKSLMMLAKANVNILDFICKTVNITDEQRKDYLNTFIENVVKKPNKVELDVEDEINYNELIIRYQGDIGRAQVEFEKIKSHREEEFDIIVEMIDWIYSSNKEEEVNPMVRLNMLSVTKDLNEKAINRHISNYRNSFKNTYPVKINDYETNANLVDESGECAKLKSFVEEKKKSALASVKTWISFIGFAVAILAVVGGIMLAPPLFVFTVAGIAFGIIYLFVCKAKRAAITRNFDNEYAVSEATMRNIIAEFRAYTKEFREYDSDAQKITDELDKL